MPASLDPWFVAIGASGADGLRDIEALPHALPPSLNATVLIVLHRPWDRHSHLRAVLARVSRVPMVIAAQGERFETGTGLCRRARRSPHRDGGPFRKADLGP